MPLPPGWSRVDNGAAAFVDRLLIDPGLHVFAAKARIDRLRHR